LDRPALKALPPRRYVFAEWLSPRISVDYHVDAKGHYYSVPYTLALKRDRQGRRLKVEVRLTATTMEAFCRGTRVASHERPCRLLRPWPPSSAAVVPCHPP
jgi:hypothetical protein